MLPPLSYAHIPEERIPLCIDSCLDVNVGIVMQGIPYIPPRVHDDHVMRVDVNVTNSRNRGKDGNVAFLSFCYVTLGIVRKRGR